MSAFAALFIEPCMMRAGYVSDPGTGGRTELYHPCVGCWKETVIVGAIVGEDQKVLIHVEAEGERRSSPAYYCAPCWAREVEPRIKAFARSDATVSLVGSPGGGA